MTTEDTYLRSVERMLSSIAPEHRDAVLDDLRGHFADAVEAGRSIDDVIAGLGSPAEISERAAEEFPGPTAGTVAVVRGTSGRPVGRDALAHGVFLPARRSTASAKLRPRCP